MYIYNIHLEHGSQLPECLIPENKIIQAPLPLNLDEWTRFNPTVLGALGHPYDRSRWSCAATAVPAVPWCTAS